MNNAEYNQISTILNGLYEQATGKKAIGPIPTNQFVSVAQTTLKCGYETLLNAISQMVNRTIFSVRPYTRKFAGLKVDNQKFGAVTRKLKISDKSFENDQRYELVEGASIDMFKVAKPNILQLNFYGSHTYQKHYTIFKDQLDTAFTGPQQLAEFMTMVTTNASNQVEKSHESLSRAVIANYIAGKHEIDAKSVIHLLTEYNAITGLALDKNSVYQPDNFKPFMAWVYSRVAELSSMMTEYTNMYQVNITGKEVTQHSPTHRQKVYLFAPYRYQTEAMVLADTYHDTFLKMADNDTVNYWQDPLKPNEIQVAPVYMDTTGELIDGSTTTIEDIFGVIFDSDTMGYTTISNWSAATPLNAAGGYWNVFMHWTDRYWTDYTEKGIILMMD